MNNFSQSFPNQKEKTDFWIAITVIVLFLAAIIYYVFPSGGAETNKIAASETENTPAYTYESLDNSKEVVYNEGVENEESLDVLVAAVAQDSVEENKMLTGKVEKEIEPKELEESEEKENLINTLKDKTEEELPVYIDEDEPTEELMPSQKEEEVLEVKEEAKEEESIETVEEETKIETEAETELETDNKGIKLESKTTTAATASTYGCIVIVGSFKEPKNSKGLIRKLEKQNYPVYEGAYKGYYVVGVNSDCEAAKIKPLLKKLRTKFEKSAWIYRR